jgi:endonuclease/exonuclease/phosphatase family metal-dependent hydrolase
MTRGRVLAAAVLAAVCALLAGAPAGAARPHAVQLRVATYNIQAGMGADGVFNVDRTAAAIGDLHADIVGLQEVDVHWSARSGFTDVAGDLARRLRMRVFFAPIYSLDPLTEGAPRREFGVAILTRLPILHAGNHEITRLSTQVPNPVPAPAPGFPEVVVVARGVVVHVYTTHLDYRSDPAVRAAQVADMLAVTRRDREPKILVGDFNATAAAPELAPLWTDFTDAWGGAPGGESYPAAAPDRRIDFITGSPGVGFRGVEVVDTLASDHRPVVADLTVQR